MTFVLWLFSRIPHFGIGWIVWGTYFFWDGCRVFAESRQFWCPVCRLEGYEKKAAKWSEDRKKERAEAEAARPARERMGRELERSEGLRVRRDRAEAEERQRAREEREQEREREERENESPADKWARKAAHLQKMQREKEMANSRKVNGPRGG